MSKITNKPHLIFWLSIPIIMFSGFIIPKDDLVFNIRDIYYVVSLFHLNILISILFGIIGLGYWIMLKVNKQLSKWLNLAHIALTIGGVVFVWILAQLFQESIIESNFNDNLALVIDIIALTSIFGQIIFPINIIKGIINKRNRTSS